MKAGKLFGAWVYIHRSGEKKHMTYKHSTEKRPASFKLLPGVYDIKVRDDSVPEKPVFNVKGVEVKAGATLEKIVEFAGEGFLEVSPVKAGKLFSAWVYIHRSGEKKHLTYKRSTKRRPASFKLLPGVYDIKATDDSVPEKPVANVKGLEVKAGEILVCDAIDPGMTFVVPLASGIVERRGGMLIHGAIIAREYGLPCVTGAADAAKWIKTGDTITVDGFLGIVIIGETTIGGG